MDLALLSSGPAYLCVPASFTTHKVLQAQVWDKTHPHDKILKEDFSSNVSVTFFFTSLYLPHRCTLLLLLSLDGWVGNICSLSALRTQISTQMHSVCVCVFVLTCSTCNNMCCLSAVILQLILFTFFTLYLLYFHLYLTELMKLMKGRMEWYKGNSHDLISFSRFTHSRVCYFFAPLPDLHYPR